MGWYKSAKIKFAQTGEYWIQDGSAMFADGDIGDMNHEAMVLESVRAEIASLLGKDEFNNAEYVDWDALKENVIQEMIENKKSENQPSFTISSL